MSTLYLLLHSTLLSKYDSSSSREKSTVLNIGSVEYWQSIRPLSTASSLHTIIMAHGIYELVVHAFLVLLWECEDANGNIRCKCGSRGRGVDGKGWERGVGVGGGGKVVGWYYSRVVYSSGWWKRGG